MKLIKERRIRGDLVWTLVSKGAIWILNRISHNLEYVFDEYVLTGRVTDPENKWESWKVYYQ